jgi:hypothetical protein
VSLTVGRVKVVLQGRRAIKIPESVAKARLRAHHNLRVRLRLIVVVAVVYSTKSLPALGDGCTVPVSVIQTLIVQVD